MPTWLLFPFVVVFYGAGIFIASSIIPSVVASRQAGGWPTVQGVIKSSALHEVQASKGGRRYLAIVEYDYDVNGTAFVNHAVAHGYQSTRNQVSHQAIVDLLPESTTVAVRYDPANPQISVLSYGIHRSLVHSLGFLIVWFSLVTLFALGSLSGNSIDRTLIDSITISRGFDGK